MHKKEVKNMNIGMMQLLAPTTVTTHQTPSLTVVNSNTQVNAPTLKGSQTTFSSLVEQAISSTKQAQQTAPKASAKVEDELTEIVALLNVESPEELLTLLDIPHDDGLLMLQVGEDGKAVAIDEMLVLEDLMAALTIDAEQLLQVVQQLLGEDKQARDVWELLALVDAQAPLLQSQIVSALQGEAQVTPKEAKQLLQVLKLAELVGQKTDLTAPQENALLVTKNFLATMQTQVETILAAQQVTTKIPGTIPLQGFQQVIAQVAHVQNQQTSPDVLQQETPVSQQAQQSVQPLPQQTQQSIQPLQQQTQQSVQPVPQQTQQSVQPLQQQTQQTDTDATEVVTANTVQTKLDTFQVTLPTTKPAQSEALVKEMQTIMNKMQLSNAQGVTRLTLKLYPENLGTIRIELVQNDGVLTARLLASTAHGRELLDSQVHQLKQAFAQQNIQLERLDIAQALQDADRQQRDPNFFSNFFKQQQQQEEQEKKRDDEDETMSFSEYLINEEV